MGDRLLEGRAAERLVAGFAPPFDRDVVEAGLGEMMRDDFGLGRRAVGIVAEDFGRTAMQRLAAALEQAPRSSRSRVTSSTNSGTPPVRSLTPSTTSLLSARRAASPPTISATSARPKGLSETTLWCERRIHAGRNSGRAVARMKSGA